MAAAAATAAVRRAIFTHPRSIPGRSDQVRRVFQMISNGPFSTAPSQEGCGFRQFRVENWGKMQGTKQEAQEITSAITEGLPVSLENVTEFPVSQGGIRKDPRLYVLQRQVERLRNDVEKLQTELENDVDMVMARLRADLISERGCTRDKLWNQSTEIMALSNKLNREILVLGTEHVAAKGEVIKYCIGTLFCFSAGLVVIRILL